MNRKEFANASNQKLVDRLVPIVAMLAEAERLACDACLDEDLTPVCQRIIKEVAQLISVALSGVCKIRERLHGDGKPQPASEP